MSVKEFLKSKLFFKHLIIAFGAGIGIIVLTFLFLRIYTRHGNSFETPNLQGLSLDNAKEMLKKNDLNFQIIDSVYNPYVHRGAVIAQNPAPGFQVKKGRTIFLTINSFKPQTVKMPDVRDVSLRQAQAIINAHGLQIGEISYKPDIAFNNVLKQRYNGKNIAPGTKIQKGSKINLILGTGRDDKQANIPDIRGMELDKARSTVFQSCCNIGNIKYDNTIKDLRDSLSAKVYKQSPPSTSDIKLPLGGTINLWLTKDTNKLPKNKQENFKARAQ